MGKNISDLILEPIITEKSTALSLQNKYTFKVATHATKGSIKQAFIEVFPGRKITNIKTIKIQRGTKRTKSGLKFLSDQKKAVITIDGPRIEYFPEVS